MTPVGVPVDPAGSLAMPAGTQHWPVKSCQVGSTFRAAAARNNRSIWPLTIALA